MTEFGFFASLDGDRVYSDGDFADYYKELVSSGVILSAANALAVTAGVNMTLNVADGGAMLEGRWFRAKEGETVVIPNANGAYPRFDRVVLRCDYAERRIYFTVIQGTAASSPTIPPIVRDGTVFDLGLAVVHVGAGVTQITQQNITDTRPDNAVCGFVHGLIDQINSAGIFAQFTAWWNEFLEQLGEDDRVTIHTIDEEARSPFSRYVNNAFDTDIITACG